MNGENIKPGDFVWIDSAPLVASPVESGKLTEVEVLSVPHAGQFYCCPIGMSPLYVNVGWLRPGDTPKSIDKKFAAVRGIKGQS